MVPWKRSLAVLVIFVVVLLGAALASPQSPAKCSDEKSHQFDFWIGEWEVYSGEQLAGHNRIEPILDGWS